MHSSLTPHRSYSSFALLQPILAQLLTRRLTPSPRAIEQHRSQPNRSRHHRLLAPRNFPLLSLLPLLRCSARLLDSTVSVAASQIRRVRVSCRSPPPSLRSPSPGCN